MSPRGGAQSRRRGQEKQVVPSPPLVPQKQCSAPCPTWMAGHAGWTTCFRVVARAFTVSSTCDGGSGHSAGDATTQQTTNTAARTCRVDWCDWARLHCQGAAESQGRQVARQQIPVSHLKLAASAPSTTFKPVSWLRNHRSGISASQHRVYGARDICSETTRRTPPWPFTPRSTPSTQCGRGAWHGGGLLGGRGGDSADKRH